MTNEEDCKFDDELEPIYEEKSKTCNKSEFWLCITWIFWTSLYSLTDCISTNFYIIVNVKVNHFRYPEQIEEKDESESKSSKRLSSPPSSSYDSEDEKDGKINLPKSGVLKYLINDNYNLGMGELPHKLNIPKVPLNKAFALRRQTTVVGKSDFSIILVHYRTNR